MYLFLSFKWHTKNEQHHATRFDFIQFLRLNMQFN
jgi:hypothetical protein